jgi:hypothetical protein
MSQFRETEWNISTKITNNKTYRRREGERDIREKKRKGRERFSKREREKKRE